MKKWTPCLKIKGVKIDSTMWQYIKFRYVLYYRQVSNFQWASLASLALDIFFCKLSKIPFFIWSVTSREKELLTDIEIFEFFFYPHGVYWCYEVLIIVWCYWHYPQKAPAAPALIWSHKKFLSDTQIARFLASFSTPLHVFSLEIKMTTLMTNKPRGHELPRLKMWLKLPSDLEILEIPFENSTNGSS